MKNEINEFKKRLQDSLLEQRGYTKRINLALNQINLALTEFSKFNKGNVDKSKLLSEFANFLLDSRKFLDIYRLKFIVPGNSLLGWDNLLTYEVQDICESFRKIKKGYHKDGLGEIFKQLEVLRRKLIEMPNLFTQLGLNSNDALTRRIEIEKSMLELNKLFDFVDSFISSCESRTQQKLKFS